MSVGIGAFLRDGILLAAYAAWTDAVPGVLLAAALGRRSRGLAAETAAAFALLLGIGLHLVLWAALRWRGMSFGAIQGVHAALAGLLTLSLLDRETRDEAARVARAFASADVALFAAAAVAAAAVLTYGPIQDYYSDELLRLGFAGAAMRSFPAQNPLVWSGTLKYHYGGDFFAACLSANTGIPLPVVYFRYFLPFNWLLLLLGMRGLLKLFSPRASNLWALGSFALFFFAHGNQVTHFTFRENTFCLGLCALGLSALAAGLSSESAALLAAAAAAAGPATFAKAPGGCLYTAFVWLACALFLRARRIRPATAIGTALAGGASWLAAYRIFLSGGGAQGGAASVLRVGDGLGTLQIFVSPMLQARLHRLVSFLGEGHRLFRPFYQLANVSTLAILGALPLTAAAAYFARPGAPRLDRDDSDASLMLAAALGVFLISGVFFCCVHYRISMSSDRYWVWFGLWFLSAIAYPALSLASSVERLPAAARRLGWTCVAASALLAPFNWRGIRAFAAINSEGWTAGKEAACDYLRERSAADDLYVHNVLDRPHWALAGLCGRRMFTSYTEHDGVWENPQVYDRSRDEAESFFSGAMPSPEAWLRRNDIRWVYWDRTARQYGRADALAGYRFLTPVVSNQAAVLYRVGGS